MAQGVVDLQNRPARTGMVSDEPGPARFEFGEILPFGIEPAAADIELFGRFRAPRPADRGPHAPLPAPIQERRWRSLIVKSAGQGHDGLAGKRESIDPKRRDRAQESVAGAAIGPAPLKALVRASSLARAKLLPQPAPPKRPIVKGVLGGAGCQSFALAFAGPDRGPRAAPGRGPRQRREPGRDA